jgi:hypothetical protein
VSEKNVHKQLMERMRSPKGAYDPIPPSQHARLMDRDMPPMIRALGWLYSKTIHPTRKGKGFTRSEFPRDERGTLGNKHCADYFDWPESMASRAFADLQEEEFIFRDDQGRICVNGDASEPELTPRPSTGESEKTFCTDNLPADMSLFLQSLPILERTIAERDVQTIEEWGRQAKAQAMAQAQAARTDLLERYFEARGFRRKKPRGRPREQVKHPQPLAVQLELKALPNLSVQITSNGQNEHSVQNGSGIVSEPENGSEQKTASLLDFQSNQSSQSEVNPQSVEMPAEEQEKVAPAAQPSGPDETLPDEVTEQNLIRAALEKNFRHPLRTEDNLPADFLKLARQHGLPARAIVRWIDDKFKTKALGKIWSPGALLRFAIAGDLRTWVQRNRNELSNMAAAEEREARARMNRQARAASAGSGGDPPFTPESYGPTMEDLKKSTRLK